VSEGLISLGRRRFLPPTKAWFLLLVLLKLGCHPLFAEEPYNLQIPFKQNENGHIIVELSIGSGTRRIPTRWLFDTGSALVLASDRLPPGCFSTPDKVVRIRDSSGTIVPNKKLVSINELYIGDHKIENIDATKMNFTSSNKYEDEPTNGIIGMSVLKNFWVKIDFINKTISLSNRTLPSKGRKLPIKVQGVPTCRLRNGSQFLEVICDTGSNGSINLPPLRDSTPQLRGGSYSAGIFSNYVGSSTELESLVWPGRHWFSRSGKWSKPSVGVIPASANGTIGMKVWAASDYVIFDFINDWVIFPDRGPELPLDASAGPLIPVAWDRTDPSAPKLVVEEVAHLTPRDRSGFQSGDVVLSINKDREGLSRRKFNNASMVSGSIFEVMREGKEMTLKVPATR
jgi:hypothetical protein